MLFRVLSLLPLALGLQVQPSDPQMYVEGRHVLLPDGNIIFDNACVTMNLVFKSVTGGSISATMTPNNNSFRVKIYNKEGLYSERLFFTSRKPYKHDEVDKVDLLEGKSLPPGEYHLKLTKTTEASEAAEGSWHILNWAVVFEHFEVDGYEPLDATLSPLAKPRYQVEIWGDSGTTGIGVHAPMELRDSSHNNDNGLEDDDCSVGFQAMLAEEINAELHNTGRGGTVIADPKEGIPTRLMAALNEVKQYRHDWSPLKALKLSPSRVPLGPWSPDLILVYGGANDYGGSKGDETEMEGGEAGTPSFSEFRAAYENFLYSLASANMPLRPHKKLAILNLCGGFDSQGDNFVCPHVAKAVEDFKKSVRNAVVMESLYPNLHVEFLQFPEDLLDESMRTAGNHFTLEGHTKIHQWLTPLVSNGLQALAGEEGPVGVLDHVEHHDVTLTSESEGEGMEEESMLSDDEAVHAALDSLTDTSLMH